MAGPFQYRLSFRIHADTSQAIRTLDELQGKLRSTVGPQATRGRVQSSEQIAASQAKETKATKDAAKGIDDKAESNIGLMGVMKRALGVYWTTISAFYAVRNAVQLVIGFYRQLWAVIRRGIGLLAGLAQEVLKNTAAFETLRIRMEAVSKSTEAGRAAFERLTRWVIGMPFTLREAADAYVYLEATGVSAMMGFARSMEVAGAMAKVMDRSIKDAALAIAKLYAGNMQRLTRGFAVTGESLLGYGARAGDKPGTLEHKAPGAGRANVEALYRFVEDRWGTLLERMRNTWKQLVNDMIDLWDDLTRRIGEAGALGALKDIVAYTRELYAFIRDKGPLKEWAQAISDAWTPIIESVGPWFEGLPGIMETVVGWTVALGDRTSEWLDKMGGVKGLWDTIFGGIEEHGPVVLGLLRLYTQVMTLLAVQVTRLAALLVDYAPVMDLLSGRAPKKEALGGWAMRSMGLMKYTPYGAPVAGTISELQRMGAQSPGARVSTLAERAVGDIEKTIFKALDNIDAALKNIGQMGWGGVPGQPGFTKGAGMTTGGAGGAREAYKTLAMATEVGTEAGTTKALDKFFGKDEKGFNPFRALYQMITGTTPPSGKAGRRPLPSWALAGIVPGTTHAPGTGGYQAFAAGRGLHTTGMPAGAPTGPPIGQTWISPRPLWLEPGMGGFAPHPLPAAFPVVDVHAYLGGKRVEGLAQEVVVESERRPAARVAY